MSYFKYVLTILLSVFFLYQIQIVTIYESHLVIRSPPNFKQRHLRASDVEIVQSSSTFDEESKDNGEEEPVRWNDSRAGTPAVLRELFRERLDTLETVCRDNRRQVPREVSKNNFLFNVAPDHKLIMCKSAKHGTTTWSEYFVQILTAGGATRRPDFRNYNDLEEEIEDKLLSDSEKQKMIENLKYKDHEFMSFFVCRNPIEKLLSVFDMKKEQHRLEGGEGDQGDFLTWPQILSLWSEDWRDSEDDGDIFGAHHLQRIADSLYQKCSPCNLHYHAVVKMETFNRDARTILETAGLAWVAPSHQNDRGSHVTQRADMQQIFNRSSKEVIRGIIKRYYMDFKICGYDETLTQLQILAKDPDEDL